MNIIIAGDFFVADNFRSLDLIDKSVTDIFLQADYRILNLEAPITNDNPENRILKTGRHFRMSEETVAPYFKQLKVDCVTMANNHILDYGEKGVLDSFDMLDRNAIAYVGAGENLSKAIKPLTIEKDDVKIAILNFCENEWSIADKVKPGANPMDIISNVQQIQYAKTTHDKVICIIHGGHEYYQLPSPRIIKQYRFYADNGADAIVGHHTHCIGGFEVYKDTPIFYSIGNFLFTINSKKDLWYNGLMLSLSIEKEKSVFFKIIPINQQRQTFHTQILLNDDSLKIYQEIERLSSIIKNEEELEKNWISFQKKKEQVYLNIFNPIQIFNNRLIVSLFTRLKLNKGFMKRRQYKYILNILRCESHYSLVVEILTNFIKR